MKHTSIGVVASLASAAALAQSVGFDSDAVGSVSAGWIAGAAAALYIDAFFANAQWEAARAWLAAAHATRTTAV